MQIRKNTKPFKTILNIIESCKDRPDRDQLVRLYITRAGQTVFDRVYIEGIQSDANIFYEMNFQTILANLQTSGYQLYMSDELPGIYFLRGPNTTWDETPFEFAEIITKKFAGLPDLPVTRKKETPQKFSLPTAKETATHPAKSKQEKHTVAIKEKPIKVRQPSFGLNKEIEFTHLEKLVYTQTKQNKRDVLSYYDKVADYLLPWLKERQLWVRMPSDTPTDRRLLTEELWKGDSSFEMPAWVQKRTTNGTDELIACKDKEHLFFFLERGCLEFTTSLTKLKAPDHPDFAVLAIDSTDLTRTVDTVLAIQEVMNGLGLPAYLKTDGHTGFHMYIPLDGSDDFDSSYQLTEFVARLVRLKIPELVTLNTDGELTYGKVVLNYHLNTADEAIVAPYSLVPGTRPLVATPIEWEELSRDFSLDDLTIDTVVKRLAKSSDPFEKFSRKTINAKKTLQQLEERYSFLF